MILVLQIISGTVLTFYYVPYFLDSFGSVQFLMYEVSMGWFMRLLHMNMASLFFLFLYLHIFKGFFFSSYRLSSVWLMGMLIFLMVMGAAFSGYSIVWSQMSYWGIVVITNLFSVIPVVGPDLVLWVWGGFYVGNNSLKFFFTVHFLLPYFVLVLLFLHLYFLHFYGSSDFLGFCSDSGKIVFSPYYVVKDFYNFFVFLLFFVFFLFYPTVFSDSGLFMPSNQMISPSHIVPEWYFLPEYGALRSIPSKILGVIFMFMMLLEMFFLGVKGGFYKYSAQDLFFFVITFILIFCYGFLGWLGQCLAEAPFIIMGLVSLVFYFFLLFLYNFCYYLSYLSFFNLTVSSVSFLGFSHVPSYISRRNYSKKESDYEGYNRDCPKKLLAVANEILGKLTAALDSLGQTPVITNCKGPANFGVKFIYTFSLFKVLLDLGHILRSTEKSDKSVFRGYRTNFPSALYSCSREEIVGFFNYILIGLDIRYKFVPGYMYTACLFLVFKIGCSCILINKEGLMPPKGTPHYYYVRNYVVKGLFIPDFWSMKGFKKEYWKYPF